MERKYHRPPGFALRDTFFRFHGCPIGRPLLCPLSATNRLSECSGFAGIDLCLGDVYIDERNDHQAAMIVGVEIENDVMIAARPPLSRLPSWAAVFDFDYGQVTFRASNCAEVV